MIYIDGVKCNKMLPLVGKEFLKIISKKSPVKSKNSSDLLLLHKYSGKDLLCTFVISSIKHEFVYRQEDKSSERVLINETKQMNDGLVCGIYRLNIELLSNNNTSKLNCIQKARCLFGRLVGCEFN